jgi:hypothetical protein
MMTPRSTPAPESSPSVSSTPVRPPSPEVTPSPLHRPDRMMSPGPGATVSPPLAPGVRRVAPPGFGPRHLMSPTATPEASSNSAEGTTARITPRGVGEGDRPVEKRTPVYRDRQLQGSGQNASVPSTSVDASTSPSAPSREEKRARRGGEQLPATTPTSSPSATP